MDQALEIVSSGKLLHVRVSGKLTKESYETFTPLVDQLITEHGKLRVLFEMHDFHGWTAGAMWEDIKFDFKHWKDVERLAFVARPSGKLAWPLSASPSPVPRSSTSIELNSPKPSNGSKKTEGA